MSKTLTHLMRCEITGRMVQAIIDQDSTPGTIRVVECPGKAESCYGEACAFTTDGGEVLVVDPEPFITDYI